MSQHEWQWHEDDLNVVTIIALSQGPNKLRRLARQHKVFEDGLNRDIGEILQRLQEIAQRGGDFTKEIGKDLDRRFRSTLLRVRSLEPKEVQQLEMKWPLPLMWATMRDEREEVRRHARNQVYGLIWRALREMVACNDAGSNLDEAVKSLQAQNRVQAAELENLRLELEKKKVDAQNLKKVPMGLEPGFSGREREKIGQGRLKREIKKLSHELNREREKVKELMQRLSGLNGCRLPFEGAPVVDEDTAGSLSPGECLCTDEACFSACGELCREDGAICGECPLGGLRVAVVGGLQRMLPVYRKIVSDLGAEFVFHNGRVRNGRYRLRSLVCGADIVVFITSVNSHGALDVVKAACEKTGKQFIASKETGPETLGRLLRACCA
jgi:hypothetical protein